MGRPLLLPGERVEATLRPAWRTGARWYLAALAFPLAGLALRGLLASDAWAAGNQGPWWRFWNHLYGSEVAAHALVLALLAVSVLGAYLALRQNAILVAGLVLVAWISGVATQVRMPYEAGLPLAVASSFLPAALAIEADRLTRTLTVTNLRLLGRGGFVRHDDVRDVELRQGAIGRALDVGDLLVVASHAGGEAAAREDAGDAEDDGGAAPYGRSVAGAVLQFPGVHPARRVRELVELVIRDATASAYLRAKEDLPQRRQHALEALQRR